MKIRNGFVSNSSSSSFICDVCNELYEECESYDEAEMVCCKRGHTFCDSHLKRKPTKESTIKLINEDTWFDNNPDEKKEILKQLDSMNDEEIEELLFTEEFYELYARWDFPTELCPVCNLEDIRESDVLKYILHENGVQKLEVENLIKDRFENLDELYEYINGSNSNED